MHLSANSTAIMIALRRTLAQCSKHVRPATTRRYASGGAHHGDHGHAGPKTESLGVSIPNLTIGISLIVLLDPILCCHSSHPYISRSLHVIEEVSRWVVLGIYDNHQPLFRLQGPVGGAKYPTYQRN